MERYKAVLDAFMTGLEQRTAKGGNLDGIESVASFFVSRVDTEVDRLLDRAGGQRSDLEADAGRLRGQAAIANSRLAYEVYEQMLASPRWRVLAAKARGRSGCYGRPRASKIRPMRMRATSSNWSRRIR